MITLAQLALGHRPFLDPLDLHDRWWLTAVPLVFFLSMAYKAARVGDLGQYWKHVATMSVQLLLLLLVLAAGLHALIEWIIPIVE